MSTRPSPGAPQPLARSSARRSAFTLIELLVVIAIIAILAAILLPVFATAREHARRSACTSNLGKVGAALELYRQDQGGYPIDLWPTPAQPAPGSPPPGYYWRRGLVLLLGKSSPWVVLSPADSDAIFLSSQPAYLGSIDDLHCPDNFEAPTRNTISTPTTVGFDNYDGPDRFAQAAAYPSGPAAYGPGNWVSTRKYSLVRLTPNDWGNGTYTTDYSNPDYTRQLRFSHPDDDTVVTWCEEHRPRVNGIPTPDPSGKDDLFLFKDGKVRNKFYQTFNSSGTATHPVVGNGLHSQTDP